MAHNGTLSRFVLVNVTFTQDFGLSRHIVQADGINGGGNSAEGSVSAAVERLRGGGDAEGGPDRLGLAAGEESITGGVGTYLYGSPEQMSGKP